ncbi:hypothetical protein ACFFX1_31825 [Dactylosporangium sucinum]|uniref:Uncharacterized protein n=1 Tax=Dactylosporangium sucinum TaxID=1424081 RepID=A0A917WL88_9ACTN|nr:hypothetical protein [Dactylosporangium sucinum]GGM14093.1 hypothetical protein GCM10007977_013940 [Dactylosporangium sucinum]
MARIGQLFGSRTRDGVGDDSLETTERKIDRDRDGVDDRLETTERNTTRIPAAGTMDGDTDRLAARRSIDRESPTVPAAPVSPAPGPAPDLRPVPARASLLATFGLMLGMAAVAVSLTGLLAPWAIPVGALGLMFSFAGIVAGARPGVAGRGLGTLGVLASGTAIVFAIIAMTGQVSWLDSNVDQVARLNGWLDAKLPWMKDW